MIEIFADTNYWIAKINPHDQWHESAIADYSLTDCISMNVMRERGIADALTHDRNFAQEGFNPLL